MAGVKAKQRSRKRKPGGRVKDPVPVGPLRERVLALIAEGETYSEIAKRIGWVDPRGRPDTSRLQRRLGLRREAATRKPSGKVYGGGPPHGLISYARAVEVCRGLGCDPVDIKDENGESLL